MDPRASLTQTEGLIRQIHQRGDAAIKQITDNNESLTERLHEAIEDYFRYAKDETPSATSLSIREFKAIDKILQQDAGRGRKTGFLKRAVKRVGYAVAERRGNSKKTQSSVVWALVEEAFQSIDAGIRGRSVTFPKLDVKAARAESKADRMIARGGVELPGLRRSRGRSLEAPLTAQRRQLPKLKSLEDAARFCLGLKGPELKALGGRPAVVQRLLDHYREYPREMGGLMQEISQAAETKLSGDYKDLNQKLLGAKKALEFLLRDALPDAAQPLASMEEAFTLWELWGNPETALAYRVLGRGLVDGLDPAETAEASRNLFTQLEPQLTDDGPMADLASATIDAWLADDVLIQDLYDPTLDLREVFQHSVLDVRISPTWIKEFNRSSVFQELAQAHNHREACRALALGHCLVKGTRSTPVFLRQMLVELKSQDRKRMENAMDLLTV